MKIAEKTLYNIIRVNREEREKSKRKLKVWINYIKVSLNSESEIKLKEKKKNLINTVTDVYAVHINAAHNKKKAAGHLSAEKSIQDKYY